MKIPQVQFKFNIRKHLPIIVNILFIAVLAVLIILMANKNNFSQKKVLDNNNLPFAKQDKRMTGRFESKEELPVPYELPHKSVYTIFDRTIVRTSATVSEIIEPGETYKVTTVDGEDLTITVTPETITGNVWFEVYADGSVKQSADEVEFSALNSIAVQDTIIITYQESDLTTVDAEEFIVL
jgi:hypothetical protein